MDDNPKQKVIKPFLSVHMTHKSGFLSLGVPKQSVF
jgi:hypothetical protein